MAASTVDLPPPSHFVARMNRLTAGPETRQSLLIRLRDPRDDGAWSEFASLYEPVIYRMSKARGLQDADAREIVQEVLLSVSSAIENFDLQASGSFRGWLTKVTRNATVDHFRRRDARIRGITDGHDQLHLLVTADDLEDEFDRSRREQLFRWAAGNVRKKTSETNWMAFWRSSVDGQPIADVAADLGISEGAVYVARCRILKRIRELVRERLED